METVTDFIFLGSKITADGDCSHEINRHLLLGRKAMANLDSVLRSRDKLLCQITFLKNVHIVKVMVFPQSCTDVRGGPKGRLSAEELMFLNCVVGEDS